MSPEVIMVFTDELPQRISWQFKPCFVWTPKSASSSGVIQSIRSHVLIDLVRNQIHTPRQASRKRLLELGEAIPVTPQDQYKFLSALFARYTEGMKNAFIYEDLEICNGSASRMLEHSLKRILEIFDSVASKTFSRFPPVLEEMKKISISLSSDFIRPRLEQVAIHLHQNHFLLLHAFECETGDCSGKCAYVLLFRATITQLMDRVRSSLFTIVANKLPSWVCFLHEPGSTRLERERLKRKLKVMHKLYALL